MILILVRVLMRRGIVRVLGESVEEPQVARVLVLNERAKPRRAVRGLKSFESHSQPLPMWQTGTRLGVHTLSRRLILRLVLWWLTQTGQKRLKGLLN